MVVLVKNTSVTVDMTLSDKKTIDNPYYLMVMDGRSGQARIKFLMTDTSSYPDRYNRFTIEEGVTFTGVKGDYAYMVLQKATESTDIDGDEVVLEYGLARINDDVAADVDTFTTTAGTITFEND